MARFVFLLILVAQFLGTGSAHADQSTPPGLSTAIVDVELAVNGTVTMIAVNQQGERVAGIPFWLRSSRGDQQLQRSNADGMVVFTDVQPGSYEVQGLSQRFLVRVWTPAAAPPIARKRLLFVADNRVIRGQLGGYTTGAMLGNPYSLGGIFALMIGGPLLLDDDDGDASQ